jgi:hypothetical protein
VKFGLSIAKGGENDLMLANCFPHSSYLNQLDAIKSKLS